MLGRGGAEQHDSWAGGHSTHREYCQLFQILCKDKKYTFPVLLPIYRCPYDECKVV